MSIRLRLAALFTLATMALVGGAAYVFVAQLRAGLQDSLDQTLQARAAVVMADLGANRTADGLLRAGADSYAQLYSAEGSLLRSARAISTAHLLTPADVATATTSDLHFNMAVPLRSGAEIGTEQMRVYATNTGDHTDAAVAASRDLVDEAVQRTQWQMTILGAVALVLAGPGSWLLARAALRPVERMRAQVARLEADDAAEGLTVPPTGNELARLAGTFNTLLERLHAAVARERAFVADAGHELRTPLTVLRGEFELAQRPGRTRDELAQTIEIAAEETERLIGLTENLLVLARESDTTPLLLPVDLADIARDAIASAAPRAATRRVTLRLTEHEPTRVVGDPDRLRQAIDNLTTNALRHSKPSDTITLEVGTVERDAVICVRDQGPGFPPDFLPVAFERFTRGDDAHTRGAVGPDAGNGLGLAIVAAIAASHGGVAVAQNDPDGGAVVTVRWPQPVAAPVSHKNSEREEVAPET